MEKKESVHLFIRLLLLLSSTLLAGFCFMHKFYFTGFMLVVFVLIMVIEGYYFMKRYFNKIDKVISSMLYDDFTVDYQFNDQNQTLIKANKLYYKLKEKDRDAVSQKMLYDQILNGLDSGLIILDLSKENQEIMLMNEYFQQYFAVPVLKDWKLMANYLGDFYELLEAREFTEFKTTLDIQVDRGERQTFVIQTSITQIKQVKYYTVLIDSIQRVIYSKENEAWVSVMKVISHELMNSLAPIHALAQNMDDILKQEKWSIEDQEDMKISIGTIINRSNHLQDFVDRYRKLTMLPSPVLATVDLNLLVHSMISNYQLILSKREIELKIQTEPNIYAELDQSQFEQVLVNLFTNSLHALTEVEKKLLEINIYQNNSRIFIEFTDSGPIIDETIVSKIFLPFYTTRKDGAGIGLSLSKAIIEAHKGYLYYQLKNNKNCFVIVLIK